MSATVQGKLDQRKFGSVVVTNLMLLFGPFLVATFVLQAVVMSGAADTPLTLFGVPLVAIGVAPVGMFTVGPLAVGLISFGGVGVISFAGVGLVSFGGAGVGVLAMGGAVCGLIAVGGAAVGYVAAGGAALGVYVLAGSGKGRYVFDRRRQDPEAVVFFCKYVPRLKRAFTA